MKRIFSGRVKTVIIIAFLLTVGLTVAASALNVDVPGIVVKSVLTPLRAGANAMITQAEHLYSYAFRYETLVAENAELKQTIADMQDDARAADALAPACGDRDAGTARGFQAGGCQCHRLELQRLVQYLHH